MLTRDKERVANVRDVSAKSVETCSVNDNWRQGDVEIRFIGDRPRYDLIETKLPSQLAPGTTKGSRHGLCGEGVVAYELVDRQPLEGPVLYCPNGLTVPHPEHGDITMKEPGWYAVIYQRAYAEELRRQAD